MDFISAAHYMKCGYRVRRASWLPDTYMKLGILGELEIYFRMESYSLGRDENGKPKTTKHSFMTGGGCETISVDDVLDNEWEIITTGIRKEFSKHENGMEYDDDTDWDNYVSPKGGWGDFDEDE